MNITPIAADSLGTRSMATFVETGDCGIFIDPAVSLAPRRYGGGKMILIFFLHFHPYLSYQLDAQSTNPAACRGDKQHKCIPYTHIYKPA